MVDWELIKQAVELQQINERAALMLVLLAIEDADIDFSIIKPKRVESTKGVDYGINGYTDVNDPRAENARYHSPDGQPVSAVNTLVLTNPDTEYRCIVVQVFGSNDPRGGGRTIITVAQDGHETVILGTGASKRRGEYDNKIPHVPGQEIVLSGKGVTFNPPNLGGASVFLERNGRIISDEVRSLGLSRGEHISYFIKFQHR